MKYEITAPDGRRFEVTAPEGATQQDILAYAKGSWERRQAGERDLQRMANPTGSFSENFAAGVGKGMTDIGQGIGQAVGLQSREDVTEKRRLDAPLSATGGGKAGQFTGMAVPLAATALIPGANTLTGAAAIGVGTGAMMPSESTKETALNVGLGGFLGAGGQKLAQGLAGSAQRRASNEAAMLASQKQQNMIRDETLREANKLGLVVPQSAVNPTRGTQVMEGVAGKAALGQEISAGNQKAVNAAARRHVGLPENAAISEGALKDIRYKAAQPYRDIAEIHPSAAKGLEELKEARFNAAEQWKFYARSGDPAAREKAQAFGKTAQRIENTFEELAKTTDKPNLLKNLREGRELIAKTYDVDRALNVATGDISAKILGRAVDKGRPISGELKTVGKFAEAFPKSVQDAAGLPAAGVSALDPMAAAALGILGGSAFGPAGLLAAATPYARNLVRTNMVGNLSKGVLPSYEQSALRRGMLALPQSQIAQQAGRGGILSLPPSLQQ